VIYNAVTPPPAVTPRPSPSPPPAPFRLLFAGRLVEQKGADLLPAILQQAQALASRQDVVVTVAGEGTLHAELAAAFAQGSGRWRVEMVPPIAQLSRHLGDYDAVLQPSRFEGFGLFQLEVLMAGLPLITCRAPVWPRCCRRPIRWPPSRATSRPWRRLWPVWSTIPTLTAAPPPLTARRWSSASRLPQCWRPISKPIAPAQEHRNECHRRDQGPQ
jgi:hypothetical protein